MEEPTNLFGRQAEGNYSDFLEIWIVIFFRRRASATEGRVGADAPEFAEQIKGLKDHQKGLKRLNLLKEKNKIYLKSIMPMKRKIPFNYKKTAAKKRMAAKSKGKKPLNVVEKKQVTAIAKRVVNKAAESKYFQTTRHTNLPLVDAYNGSAAVSQILAAGFAVGSGEILGNGTQLGYGYQTGTGGGNVVVHPLDIGRVFAHNAADDNHKAYAIEGLRCQPSYASCDWIIKRTALNVSTGITAVNMYVRMIRVVPKKPKFSDQSLDPKNDLFLDQYNIETGIAKTGTGVSAINADILQQIKVNSKKYRTIQDKGWVLTPPQIKTVQDGLDGNADRTYQLAPHSGQARFRTFFKLPKNLNYEKPLANDFTGYPMAGSNELIFFHACLLNPSDSTTTPVPSAPQLKANGISIQCRPVGTFKDI